VEGGETGEAVMAENTKISWADHTFNPWIGCSRVHAGCVNCYAEAMAGRLNVHWGPNNAEISHPKGGDPSEWPEDVRVQQFPIFK
jgi:protein gp37